MSKDTPCFGVSNASSVGNSEFVTSLTRHNDWPTCPNSRPACETHEMLTGLRSYASFLTINGSDAKTSFSTSLRYAAVGGFRHLCW
jgi:hypothetical protein